jgi:hypothetical protein
VSFPVPMELSFPEAMELSAVIIAQRMSWRRRMRLNNM